MPRPSADQQDTKSPDNEAWLRQRFSGGRSVAPIATGDGHLWRQNEELRPAAVLVPVVRRATGLTVLFTRRTDHLYDHAGQISFPGGRCEAEDASPAATALRETFEEIGLAHSLVEVLGALPEYTTVTGYCVTPVVGLVSPPPALKLDAFEVAEAFEVPLRFLLDPDNHQRNTLQYQGRTRHYYAIPYEQRYIWGATAGMLMNLYAYLTA
ncbi:MAG: CoA pyrophosphatase [Betaproteobacteria bacterium]|nr:MAG: CoA pyrophosphatase [Betaproteobacteria bacterium]